MREIGALFLRVLAISAGCSAVLAPVLLLAPRIQKRVAARSFYALFLLLALRLAVPVELSLPKPAVTVPVPSYTVEVSVPSYTVTVPAAPAPAQRPSQAPVLDAAPAQSVQPVPVQTEAPAIREVPVTAILGGLWAAGSAVCILWAVASYLLARRSLLRESVPAAEEETALLERLRGGLSVKRPVRLRRSGRTQSPLALGLLHPVVVLPASGCGPEELELILRHELTHIRRWDVAYKMVLSLACAVNWFNPFVWLMSQAAGRNLELCCDDEVVRGLSREERRRYGKVLLDAAETARPLAFSTSFASGKRQLRDRLTNLFTEKKNSAALVCVVLAAALLAGGLVACENANASGTPDSEENQARRDLLETWFYENYQEDTASVVLADLTGDGLDELIVVTVMDFTQSTPLPLHLWVDRSEFGAASATVYGVTDGSVAEFYRSGINYSMMGMGHTYLCPREEGGYALLVRLDDTMHQYGAFHSYELICFDEAGNTVVLDSMTSDSMAGEFRNNIQAYQDAGNPLLVLTPSAFGYWDSDPEQVFAGTDPGVFVGEQGSLFTFATPEQTAIRRALLEPYFYENYQEDTASVVLADLTGDGLEEMLVITMGPDASDLTHRRTSSEVYDFGYALLQCYSVVDGQVTFSAEFEVSSSHAAWGSVYLIPNPAGAGYALLYFRPGSGMGEVSYRYSVYAVDENGSFVTVAENSTLFVAAPEMMMITDAGDSGEQAQQVLAEVDDYRDSGVPLLAHEETVSNGGSYVAYLNTSPKDVFSGEISMELPYLWTYVMSEGGNLNYTCPQFLPSSPEEALDRLEEMMQWGPDSFLFRLPNYDGSWEVEISGEMGAAASEEFVPVRYLEGVTWVPGRLYAVSTEGAWFSKLTFWVRAVDPDGVTAAERTITLAENGQLNALDGSRPVYEAPARPKVVAERYLQAMAKQIYLNEDRDTTGYTALMEHRGPVDYVIGGEIVPAAQAWSRLTYMEQGGRYQRYVYQSLGGVEDFAAEYVVESEQSDGNSAAVEIQETVTYRLGRQGEQTQVVTHYRVDLIYCLDSWLVADVNQSGGVPSWCGVKDAESYCALTGLPHDMAWFTSYFNDGWLDRTEDWQRNADALSGGTAGKFPIDCLAGYLTEQSSFQFMLIYLCGDGELRAAQVTQTADGGYEVLSSRAHPAGQ